MAAARPATLAVTAAESSRQPSPFCLIASTNRCARTESSRSPSSVTVTVVGPAPSRAAAATIDVVPAGAVEPQELGRRDDRRARIRPVPVEVVVEGADIEAPAVVRPRRTDPVVPVGVVATARSERKECGHEECRYAGLTPGL